MRGEDKAKAALILPLAIGGVAWVVLVLKAFAAWRATDGRIAWSDEEGPIVAPATSNAPQRIALAATALLLAGIFAARHQTLKDAMQLVCEAPSHVPVSDRPDTDAAKLGKWIDERLTNDEVRGLFKNWGSPGSEERLLELRKRSGIGYCPMMDDDLAKRGR